MTFSAKHFLVSMSVAMCTAPAFAGEKPAPQPVGGTVQWVYEYEEGKKLSRETGKPMFVVFRCER